jgi:xanthine/CO dehydrogenase XdhC/CoxF family maturation factor
MVEVYQELAELISQGRSCVLITVAESQGSGPMTLGKKLLIRDDFSSVGTIGGGALEFEAIETAKEVFHQRESRLAAYLLDENQQIADHKTIPMICGGTVKLFYEYLSGGEKAYIFGGGHVGRALVRQLDLLGFYTTIVEDREDVFQDIAEGKERVFQSFDAFIQKADIDEQAFVVVCTPPTKTITWWFRTLSTKGSTPATSACWPLRPRSRISWSASPKSTAQTWTSLTSTVPSAWTSAAPRRQRSPWPPPQKCWP